MTLRLKQSLKKRLQKRLKKAICAIKKKKSLIIILSFKSTFRSSTKAITFAKHIKVIIKKKES
jgi:hypothetical protein